MSSVSPNSDAGSPNPIPNSTMNGIPRDFTFLVFGAAVYEAFTCLSLYFAICNKAKLKTPIFLLITTALFSLTLATFITITLHFDFMGNVIPPDQKYHLYCINASLMVIAKIGYFTAATLRTRALLGKFPKILICFYTLLAFTIIGNLLLLGTCFNFFTTLRQYKMAPEYFIRNIPAVDQAVGLYERIACLVTIFDTFLSNTLIVSFLYPIFTYLEMKFVSAILMMIKLGNVQKALVAAIASSLFITLTFNVYFQQVSLAVVHLWMHTENTLFLRLSYLSSTELLNQHHIMKSLGRHNPQTNEKSKDTGGTLPVDVVITPGTV